MPRRINAAALTMAENPRARAVAFTGKILSLDIATNTGFCVGAPNDEKPEIGHVKLPSTGDDIGKFAVAFEEWLDEQLRWTSPDLVVFEAPILPAKTQLITVRKLNGLIFEVERQCRHLRIRCREGRASSVRKFFCGNGRADKEDVVTMARRYGWKIATHDEADAAALWAYAVSLVAPDHAKRFALGPLGAGANG